MAKKSIIARERKKIAAVKRASSRRLRINDQIKQAQTPEDMMAARTKLNKLKRNTSRSRVQRRCQQCGRSRGVYRLFGLCRICLRNAAMRGEIPGLAKASW